MAVLQWGRIVRLTVFDSATYRFYVASDANLPPILSTHAGYCLMPKLRA